MMCAIEAEPDILFGVYNGLSRNRACRYDLADAREDLGYAPRDDTFVLAACNLRGILIWGSRRVRKYFRSAVHM